MSQSFSFERFQKLAGSLFSLYILLLLVCSMVFLSPRGTFAAQATLSWDAPTTNSDGTPLTDLAGYKVYYGTATRTYSQVIDVRNVITYQVNNLTEGFTYYFAVKAYDAARNESNYSNEVSKAFTTSIQQVTLTITKNGTGTGTGTVTAGSGISCGSDCTEPYNKGTVVTLSATPNSGSSFTGWSGGGCSGTGQCAITMNENTTVNATFSSSNTYTITASAGTGGSISPSGSVSVNQGASQTFTISPNAGYHVADVVIDGSSAGTIQSYTFSNVTSKHTIGATFAMDTPSQEIIIDNRDASTSRTGTWSVSSGVNPYGVDSLYSRDGSTFTWYFTPQQDGNHKVSMWWTYRDSRSTNVPVDIEYSGGTARVFVNQTQNDSTWNVLGTHPFKAGVRYKVTIAAQPSPASTCADAVKFAPLDNYLSDIEWISATNGWGPVERDMSNGETAAGDGRTITLNGVIYTKGLGVHAASNIRYNVAGMCSTFMADIGVDDETGSNGSIVFQVYGDGTKLYDSGTMTGSSQAKQVNVAISGRNVLQLVVTDAGNGMNYDHGDWANARIVCN